MPSLRRRDPIPAAPPSPAEALGERGLAGVGYTLAVAALFTFWLTGLGAFVLAWTHRKSPDPLARAHFRFQLWVADLAGLAVGIAAALVVSALVVVGGPLFEGDWPTLGDFGGAAGLVAAGVVLWAVSFAGTIAGGAWGLLRLAQGRPPLERRSGARPSSRTAAPLRDAGTRARP